jgi:hypothetical protein
MTSAYAEAESAFRVGYAAAEERQAFYMSRPGLGVAWPSDDPSWHSPSVSDVPKGLGFLLPPEPVPVYVADSPGLVPHVLPVPVPDGDLPASLTGSVHGGWRSLVPASRSAGLVDMRVPGAAAPPRRSLWSRLMGRGR